MKIFFLTLALGVLALNAQPAYARACVAPDRVGVSVRLLDPQPKLRTTKNLKQINSKAKAHGLQKRGAMVLGFTQSQVETSMNMRFSGFNQGGSTCLNVERLEARFGNTLLDVQLPREYARGSCQYKEVLKHEMEHVRVNREGVRKYTKILKRDLEKALKDLNPMRVSSMERGQAQAKRALQAVVKTVAARFNKEIAAQHAVIDQPGGPYDSTGACRSW